MGSKSEATDQDMLASDVGRDSNSTPPLTTLDNGSRPFYCVFSARSAVLIEATWI